MKLHIIIVTYKTRLKALNKLLKNIQNLKLKPYSCQIIDNSTNNIGYAKAVNSGIKTGLKKKADLFLILNPDIQITKLNLKRIKESCKQFAVFGGIFRQDNNWYYGGKIDELSMSGGLNKINPSKKIFETDFVSGSLFFITKKAISKIGYLNDKYFLYYEDVDYCQKARLNNLKVGINSNIIYDHFENSRNNSSKEYFLTKNRLKFVFKYGTLKQKIYNLLKLPTLILLYLLKYNKQNKQKLLGIVDFIKQK